jgi:hypothetical protein
MYVFFFFVRTRFALCYKTENLQGYLPLIPFNKSNRIAIILMFVIQGKYQ